MNTHGLESGVRTVRSNVVWRRISERIEERLAVIEQGIAALLSGSLSQAANAQCRAEAALLSDWLFALNQDVAGGLARDLVGHFEKMPVKQSAGTIATLVDRLRTIVRVVEQEWSDAALGDTRVHFISGADAQMDAVAWHLQQNGIDISHSPTFFTMPDNVDLIVVFSEHPSDAHQVLNLIRQRSTNVKRALVHSGKANPNELLKVASSTDLLLRYDAAPAALAQQILIAVRPIQQAWSQVVLYGANALYGGLVQVGFTGLIAQNAASVIQMVEAGSQVVVLGPEAPHRAEMVQLLRSSPATRSAIITTSYADDAERERCSRAGADFTISDTYTQGTWAEQLRAVASARDQSSGIVADESAPLPSGPRAWVLLERAIVRANREHAQASLAVISLPESLQSEQVIRIHALLADEFREEDTVVTIGSHTVAVLLRGALLQDAVERMTLCLVQVELAPVPGMVGIAEFPSNGLGVKTLVEAAFGASQRAAEGNGPVVVRSNWFPGMQDRLDVLIVESEPTLGNLLERLVANEGHTTRILNTGSAALSTLVGPDSIVPPRLILLEIDAMGADGMMIMRSIARAGVLKQSRVIITCSQINDGELREAFELGATDVLTKPFSSVVLRNRIEQVLTR